MVNTFIYHRTAIIWSLGTCEQGNQVGKMLRGKGIKKEKQMRGRPPELGLTGPAGVGPKDHLLYPLSSMNQC